MASAANVCDPACGSDSDGGFEPFKHEIYGWAYRVLGRHHDALDVVQEVFLRWGRQCASATPSRPRGWLRRVTVNLAIDALRRRDLAPKPRITFGSVNETAPHRCGNGPSAPSVDPGDAARGTIDAMDLDMLRQDIASAMDGLTDAQCGVLVAKVYDDMTFAQIAAELELAVSTVKTHYVRALRAVRDLLEPRWAPERSP